jgi:hypothetical protein
MIGLRRTFQDVARELVEGLTSGAVTLGKEQAPDHREEGAGSKEVMISSDREDEAVTNKRPAKNEQH